MVKNLHRWPVPWEKHRCSLVTAHLILCTPLSSHSVICRRIQREIRSVVVVMCRRLWHHIWFNLSFHGEIRGCDRDTCKVELWIMFTTIVASRGLTKAAEKDQMVTTQWLSLLCVMCFYRRLRTSGGCTLELGEVTQAWIILKGFHRAFGWSQSITKEPKMDVSSEIQQWVTLIVDGLNSKCSPFQIMQRIPFKSPVSSANVTAVKSCFVMSGRPLRVSVFFYLRRSGLNHPAAVLGLKIKRHSALQLFCAVTMALDIQCSIECEREQLLIEVVYCFCEVPVMSV